jgi:hypothetical protein
MAARKSPPAQWMDIDRSGGNVSAVLRSQMSEKIQESCSEIIQKVLED